MNERPSDTLRPVYERRAETGYADPAAIEVRLARKFERVTALMREYCLPCEAFLDAGCGDGRYLVAAGRGAAALAGVDLSARILETAREALSAAGLSADLRQANVEALPFADGEFDAIVCSQVIEHLLDANAGAAELARVLRPGGRLVVTTDNSRTLSNVLNAPRTALLRVARGARPRFDFPHRSFRVSEFVAIVGGSGLLVEHVETFRFHLDPPFDETRFPLGQRLLNTLDRALPAHRLGDIVAVVARKPA